MTRNIIICLESEDFVIKPNEIKAGIGIDLNYWTGKFHVTD